MRSTAVLIDCWFSYGSSASPTSLQSFACPFLISHLSPNLRYPIPSHPVLSPSSSLKPRNILHLKRKPCSNSQRYSFSNSFPHFYGKRSREKKEVPRSKKNSLLKQDSLTPRPFYLLALQYINILWTWGFVSPCTFLFPLSLSLKIS